MRIDGSKATNSPPGGRYTYVAKPFPTVPGQAVPLSKNGAGFNIYLPVVPADAAQDLSTTQSTSLQFQPQSLAMAAEVFPDLDPAMLALFSLDLGPASALDRRGDPVPQAFVVPVPPDRLPEPLPSGFDASFVVSIQAPGAENFDTPAPVTFPNTEGLAVGEKTLLFSYDHDAGDWVPVGTGTVREDGMAIVSDPGVGILAPGWHVIQTGVIVRGNFVVGQRGGLFGRSATDELSVQTGRHFYALENLDNGFIIRGVTDVVDQIFDRLVISANSRYRLSAYGLVSGQNGSVEFRTPGNGAQITAPILQLRQHSTPDDDGDGLNNEVEKIVGTAFDNPDTDGDRIRDLAELQQGLNPFDARPFPTGIISTLPLFGTANEVVIEGSLISSEAQTAYVATGTGLAIVDVTQFDNPIVLGQLDLSNASDVAIDSVRNIAAVAGSDGLHLVDVSDPMLPTLIQTIDVPANQVEVIEGVAYVTVNGGAGSQVVAYDVLTGDKLDATVSIATQYVSLAREGLMLYTLDTARTLRVIDASGFFMQSRGSLELPRQPHKIWAGGGVVYAPAILAGGLSRGGYLTIDVSDPDAPLLLADGLSTNRPSQPLAEILPPTVPESDY